VKGVRARFLCAQDVKQVETAQVVVRPIVQSIGSEWLSSVFMVSICFSVLAQDRPQTSQPQSQLRFEEQERRALEQETRAVDLQYSTKPIRVILGEREYTIPANYFGAKGRDTRDVFDAGKTGYGFRLFLPDYGGYTNENWRDKFDRRLIEIVQLKLVDKNEIVHFSNGRSKRVNPAGYGEPRAQFQNARRGLEDKPSFHAYGLEGYRPKYSRVDVTWAGTRSNGEFFFFRCNLAPGDRVQMDIREPYCDVRYYSEKEDLFIAYRYSNDHVAKWREIDDAIWAKIHSWRMK